MKGALFIFLCIIAISASSGQENEDSKRLRKGQRRIDTIAAIVNNDVITEKEVIGQVREKLKQIAESQQISEAEKAEIVKNVYKRSLQRLVEQKLIQQEAKNYNIEISEETIRELLTKELEQNEGLPMGMSEMDLADLIRHRLTLQELFQKKTQYSREKKIRARIDAYVSPQEIRQYYQDNIGRFTKNKEIKIRVITLYYEQSGGRENAQTTALGIVEDLREGADFAELARTYSQDAYAKYGGTYNRGDQLLFTIPRDYEEDLNEKLGEINQRLRKIFAKHEHELGSNIGLTHDKDRQTWEITDNDTQKEFVISRENKDKGVLGVYLKYQWRFVEQQDLLKEVADIAFNMDSGEISEMIPVENDPQMPKSCWIVKVEEIKPGKIQDFSEIQHDIRQYLRSQKVMAALQKMVEELKRHAFIWPENLFSDD